MKELSKRFLLYLRAVLHRLFLWTRPAYRKYRTGEQKQFDIKIQYMFIGCLLGMLFVASLYFWLKRKPPEPVDISTDIWEQTTTAEFGPILAQTTPEIQEPPLVFDGITPAIETTERPVTTTELSLNKNETLSGLLKRANVPLATALDATNALDIICDTRKLRAGQKFEIFFIESEFQGFRFENQKGETLSVLKNQHDEFIPQSKEGKIESQRFVYSGILENTFSESAAKLGITNNIYEQKQTDRGKVIGKPQLLYVSLVTNSKTYQRYYFIDSMGTSGYYDEKGQSTPQTIMKRPLGKGRISSPFGNRIHPILGYQIQHKGVDFPAPLGTPVPAGADGEILRIGRNGGYGKYIQIKHNETYSTAYGHLNGYKPDLKVGSKVRKGEIIGYVGNTGRSTGPHLHYEVIKNKEPVDPLKTHTIPKRVLKNQSLEQFKKQIAWLNSLPETERKKEDATPSAIGMEVK